MSLIVQKFGGTSVRDAERVMNVAKIVTDTYAKGNDVVVVVSAQGDFADVLVILVVVIINTIMSLVQESKAEAAMDALMEMTAATSKVLRNGEVVVIKSEDVVIGDIVIFEAGDAVPADCR